AGAGAGAAGAAVVDGAGAGAAGAAVGAGAGAAVVTGAAVVEGATVDDDFGTDGDTTFARDARSTAGCSARVPPSGEARSDRAVAAAGGSVSSRIRGHPTVRRSCTRSERAPFAAAPPNVSASTNRVSSARGRFIDQPPAKRRIRTIGDGPRPSSAPPPTDLR